MGAPEALIEHFRACGYHPRSDKHSNCLAEAIVADLRRHCPRIREKLDAGSLVYDLNFTILAGQAEWNVDLVFGPPALSASPATPRQAPSRIEVAVEIKAVMTEHRKAAKNRKRDLHQPSTRTRCDSSNIVLKSCAASRSAADRPATASKPSAPSLSTPTTSICPPRD